MMTFRDFNLQERQVAPIHLVETPLPAPLQRVHLNSRLQQLPIRLQHPAVNNPEWVAATWVAWRICSET